jgi:hypothetical protein
MKITNSVWRKIQGKSRGGVKRRAYQLFLLARMDEENLAEQMGLTIPHKSIEELRDEFEKENGTIYEEI